MSTSAVIGKGYTFSIGGTTIGQVEECKPGKWSQETIDVYTNDSSTLAGDKILGWEKNDVWSLKTVWFESQYAALKALRGSFHACVFTRPDGTNTTSFSGAIVEIEDDVPLKTYMMSTFKIAVTGEQS